MSAWGAFGRDWIYELSMSDIIKRSRDDSLPWLNDCVRKRRLPIAKFNASVSLRKDLLNGNEQIYNTRIVAASERGLRCNPITSKSYARFEGLREITYLRWRLLSFFVMVAMSLSLSVERYMIWRLSQVIVCLSVSVIAAESEEGSVVLEWAGTDTLGVQSPTLTFYISVFMNTRDF